MLFCISFNNLTEQMNAVSTGYEEHTNKTKISHLLYMDDFRLIGKTKEELQKQIQRVGTFSENIHMEFRFDKCAKTVLKKQKFVYLQNLILDINQEIQQHDQGITYKYPGIEESEDIHQKRKNV